MNDDTKTPDTEDDQSTAKQERVKEKLQAMGVMSDNNDAPSDKKNDDEQVKSHKIKYSILAIIITALFLFWISDTNDTHDDHITDTTADTSSGTMHDGSGSRVTSGTTSSANPDNITTHPSTKVQSTLPGQQAGTTANTRANSSQWPNQYRYPYRQPPAPPLNSQYQYPPYGRPWMPPYAPHYPVPPPYYR